MTKEIEKIFELRKTSPFTKQSYSVTVGLIDFHQKLWMYVTSIERESENINVETLYSKAIPGFQRSNDKWSRQMQIKYVENTLLGFRDEIYLFTYNKLQTDCQILDGLQRTTALLDFQEGKFEVFGDIKYKDIDDTILMNMTSYTTTLRVFEFKNEIEAVQFYIEMNENITHSSEDIEKAKKYLAKLIKEK